MNKSRIDKMIPFAYEALRVCNIADDKGRISKTFRGMISSFGAAVTMGSLLSAVCFFSDNGGASVEKKNISIAIYKVLEISKVISVGEAKTLYDYVKTHNDRNTAEVVCDAAVALKLAMNLYVLE